MQILNLFGFLSVLLRAGTVILQSLVVGGLFFCFAVLGRWQTQPQAGPASLSTCERMLRISAVCLVIVQAVYAICESTILAKISAFQFKDIVGADFFLASVVAVICTILIAVLPYKNRRSIWYLLPLAVVVLGASVATSHAFSRLHARTELTVLTMLHLVSVSCWIGGLPYLLVSLRKETNTVAEQMILRRFSRIAMVCVAVLFVSGLMNSLQYFDSLSALYGTSYGIMLLAKLALFSALLLLGAFNRSVVNRGTDVEIHNRLRYFATAEIGIGIVAILIAVSMTTQPPAVDLPTDRADVSSIVNRFMPRWPRLRTPRAADLTPATRSLDEQNAAKYSASYVPGEKIHTINAPADIAWSEYNHNWMGLLLLLIGIAATLSRLEHFQIARYWPFLFLLMGVFIFLRADPENWPLGPNGFWQSFDQTDVLVHRLAVLLVVVFALSEWRVQIGKPTWKFMPYVFPTACVLGGMLLVTHTHTLSNIKEEFLVEISHLSIAILAIVAGWSRWLQLKLPQRDQRVVSWIWPICFILMATILLDYREA